jgi:outer membrane protein OmpA-like peptidoglycan-associated protein
MRFSRPIPLFLRGLLAGLLLTGCLAAAPAVAQSVDAEMLPEVIDAPPPAAAPKKQSKDFVKAHTKKPAPAAPVPAPVAGTPVKANDLMDAMRSTLSPEAAPPAAAAPAPSPSAPEVSPPSMAASPAVPAAPRTPAPPPPSMMEGKGEPPKIVPAAPAPSEASGPAKAGEEKPASASTSSSLLSDMQDAPATLDGGKPLATAPSSAPPSAASSTSSSSSSGMPGMKTDESAILPAVASSPAMAGAAGEPGSRPGMSKPRPLFGSGKDSKPRPGISRGGNNFGAMPSAAATPLPLQERDVALPPVTSPPTESSLISPGKAGKESIWKQPKPDADPEAKTGQVLFSQNSDGTVAVKEDAPETKQAIFGAEPKLSSSLNSGASKIEGASTKIDASQYPSTINVEPGLTAELNKAPAPVAREDDSREADPAPPAEAAPTPEPVAAPRDGKTLHGSCGAANGIGTAARPTSSLCTQGSPSAVAGGGPWSWSCKGFNGGASASCAAPLQINGECGMANGSLSVSAPIGQLCASGKSTDVTGNGPWYWSCLGDNGGVVGQCVAYTMVSGKCGPAHNTTASSTPKSSKLCASGQASAISGNGPWNWNCTGSGEGTTVSCSAQARLEGRCGGASAVGSLSKPTTDLCAVGDASPVSGSGPWHWNCSGENGGKATSCSATMLANAECGNAHGISVTSKPSHDLCANGRSSDVSGSGPWNWTCLGENGGAPINCTAPLRQDGLCGVAHQNGSEHKPLSGLCNAGTPSAVSGSGPWTWTCGGNNGGITANCIAEAVVTAACGSAHGVSVTTPPTSALCEHGTPTTVIGSGPFTWSCQGGSGGSAVDCMAPMQVSGACGTANGLPASNTPSSGLCNMGTPSNVSGSGPWSWTCQGAGGGMSITCQAPMQQTTEIVTTATTPAQPVAPAAQVPAETAKAGNECTPSVKRWTITCQQGGYPGNYTGVIVGETQTLCPTAVERGVWLSNSCAPATDSAPVSSAPGRLEKPSPPPMPRAAVEDLPPIAPAPVAASNGPRKLFTPKYKGAAAPAGAEDVTTIVFASASEGLDASATRALDEISASLIGDDRSIVTLSAFAGVPADGNQQESRRLALARALAARNYLMRKGLASNRIDIRAVGPAGDGQGDDRVDIKVK